METWESRVLGLTLSLESPELLSLFLPGPSRTCTLQARVTYCSLTLAPSHQGPGSTGQGKCLATSNSDIPIGHWAILLDAHRLWEEQVGCSRRCGERRGSSWKQAPWEGEPGRVLVASALPSPFQSARASQV